MGLVLLGVGAYCAVKYEQKKDFEEKLRNFYYVMKCAKREEVNEEEIPYCVILDGTNICRYGLSNYELALPYSWKSIKEKIFNRLEKQFPNWSKPSNPDIKNCVVSREFTIYHSKNFHIKITTKLQRPVIFKTELKPYHRIDKIKIFCLM